MFFKPKINTISLFKFTNNILIKFTVTYNNYLYGRIKKIFILCDRNYNKKTFTGQNILINNSFNHQNLFQV